MQKTHENQSGSLSRWKFFTLTLVVEGGALLLAVMLAYVIPVPLWESPRLTLEAVLWGLALTAPPLAMAYVLWAAPLPGTRQLHKDFRRASELFKGLTLVELLAISVMAGVGEEALFRGVLQAYAAENAGPWYSLLVVSVLFGLAHAISRAYVVYATVLGLYLGLLFVLFDNLVVPIVVHIAYDFVALLYGARFHRRAAVAAH